MLALLALLAAAQDPSAAETAALRARVAAQPRIVEAFIARRAMCNHWGGEEPYDAARRREILRAVRSLRCAALARDEAALRRLFRSRAETLALLDETSDSLGW
jgi:hypothetical protein